MYLCNRVKLTVPTVPVSSSDNLFLMHHTMKWILLCLCLLLSDSGFSQTPFREAGPRFSTDGFFKLPDNNCRQVYSFNNGWLYHKGDIKDAEKIDFTDGAWQEVQLPHGLDVLPEFVSGGVNYQGIVWYRKHFRIPAAIRNKKITLTFEAVMGKSAVYLNGHLIKEHKGGYLPIVLDLSSSGYLNVEGENVIAVMADNSNDPTYPPGKPEYGLDFTYDGGIYRDAWLLATNDIYITNAIAANKPAGGGVRVDYTDVSETKATVHVTTDIQNGSAKNAFLTVLLKLKDKDGKIVATSQKRVKLQTGQEEEVTQSFNVSNPLLWSPDHPYLYDLYVEVLDKHHRVIDGYYIRTGIKSIELRGREGLYLNGKPFQGKLMGVNHHQAFGYIGNAVPDNLLWADAKIMRDAGIRIIRLSHYPQSPEFMDACDELGIFTIVCSPGWQFWNSKDPAFEKLMERDIRQMIRRDRNHACVFAWEPLPNETRYPKEFGKTAYDITHAEDPSQNCIAANNYGYPYWKMYDLIYANPVSHLETKTDKCLFAREWGDNVDDWSAQNAPNRVNIAWGENPQLMQAKQFADPAYYFDSWENFYEAPRQDIGDCLWHFFDTPRGYHPDPFYGGIVTAFRRPKYAYYLFQSQQDPYSTYVKEEEKDPYYLYIANIMSPFSPADVTVFTNCDSVKLVAFGMDSSTLAPDENFKMPHPPLIFKNMFHFMDTKRIPAPVPEGAAPAEKRSNDQLTAIGYANGKVVIRVTRRPAGRPAKIILKADLQGLKPVADGSFIIPVFAVMEDAHGVVKHLNDEWIRFSVEGNGVLIGNRVPGINPHPLLWGEAPALVRTTLTPGKIKITARLEYPGQQTPEGDTLILQSEPAAIPSLYEEKHTRNLNNDATAASTQDKASAVSKSRKKEMLKKVEEDQTKFTPGGGKE